MKKMWVIMGLCGLLSCAAKTQKEVSQGVSEVNIPDSCSDKTDCIEDDSEPGIFSLPYRPGVVPEDDHKIYDVVEQMPEFPGGYEVMQEFIKRVMVYPAIAKKQGIQGRVVLTFVVEKDGSLTNIRVVKSVDPALDKEAVRIVKQMPHWIPGREHDYVLRVNYTIPVTFRLDKQPVKQRKDIDRSQMIGSKHVVNIEQQQQVQRRDTTKHICCEIYEQMPSFPGGGKALLKYLEENVHYPKELEGTCVQGRVIVTCIVEKDGSITGAKVIRGLCPALDAEALRVVSAMPRWIPGRRMGEPVSVKYTIPVTFRLQ